MPAGEPGADQAVIRHDEPGDLAVDDGDPARGQLVPLLAGRVPRAVHEQGDVLAPLPPQQCPVHRSRTGREHPDRPAAHLVPVAVRAVQHVPPPALGDPGHVGQLVDQPRGHQQAPGPQPGAVREVDDEAVVGRAVGPAAWRAVGPAVGPAAGPAGGLDPARHERPAVRGHLGPSGGEQLRRRRLPRARESRARPRPVRCAACRRRPPRPAVPPGRAREPRSGRPLRRPPPPRPTSSASCPERSTDTAGLTTTFAVRQTVGPWTSRSTTCWTGWARACGRCASGTGTTLAGLSARTGISVSTLSRLESGGRRPTLELLLPLARAHGVALDELVGAPPTADPRVRREPVRRHGMTIVPLTRQPGAPGAYKLTYDRRAGHAGRTAHAATKATSGSTSSAGGCGSSSASTTSCSRAARRPSSTAAPRTGPAARTAVRWRSSACSGRRASGRTCARARPRGPRRRAAARPRPLVTTRRHGARRDRPRPDPAHAPPASIESRRRPSSRPARAHRQERHAHPRLAVHRLPREHLRRPVLAAGQEAAEDPDGLRPGVGQERLDGRLPGRHPVREQGRRAAWARCSRRP